MLAKYIKGIVVGLVVSIIFMLGTSVFGLTNEAASETNDPWLNQFIGKEVEVAINFGGAQIYFCVVRGKLQKVEASGIVLESADTDGGPLNISPTVWFKSEKPLFVPFGTMMLIKPKY